MKSILKYIDTFKYLQYKVINNYYQKVHQISGV